MVWALLAASEATTASKQPRTSNLTSDFNSVTLITHVTHSLKPSLFVQFQKCYEEGNHDPLTCLLRRR